MTAEAGAAAGKAELRSAMIRLLRAMTPDERAARSASICRAVLSSAPWQRSERILLFTPMRSEPDISALHDAAVKTGKAAAAIPSDVRLEAELSLPFDPQLILVPGLAFSPNGHRLGRGGGFYDRLLAGRGRAAWKVGICFPMQVHPAIPHEPHDIILDAVICE